LAHRFVDGLSNLRGAGGLVERVSECGPQGVVGAEFDY
jgi:hypothetical protein